MFERTGSADGFVDLRHGGRPNVIASAVLELDAGLAIVDPGPAATLAALDAGLSDGGYRLDDVTHLLLTHIHLDHAGASGHLIRDHPGLRAVVHQRGAPHLADPAKLLASATRIFGDRMDTLWGTCLPVPLDRMDIVGDEEHPFDGGRIRIRPTPGHASHHMSFFDTRTGTAYAGDAMGGRIRDKPAVLPATPPPDIDPDLMVDSIERILDWQPARLFVTHFGPVAEPAEHAERLRHCLADWSVAVRESLAGDGTDDARATAFGRDVGRYLRESLSETDAASFEAGAPPHMSWYGLARYWKKRLAAN